MGKNFISILMGVCATFVFAVNADAARQTRDLVFEDEPAVTESVAPVSNPAAPAGDAPATAAAPAGDAAATADKDKISDNKDVQVVALKATIELKRDGQESTVLPSHEFKSGDRVKLVYVPSIDGYAYWMAKGSSGKTSILFPSAQAGSDNKIERNKEYKIPVKGAFKFDDTVGKEELLCIISAERIEELDKLIAESSHGVIPAENSAPVKQIEEENTSKRQTRDLVFEEEESEDVVTKKQVAPKSEPFVTYFVLTHN